MDWDHPWAEAVGAAGDAPVVRVPAAPTDPAAVRGMFAQHPTGIVAICAEVDGARHGMIATSFTVGVSFTPPLVLFSAQLSSRTWPEIARAGTIGVSVLGAGNAAVVSAMSSRSGERFSQVRVARTEGGAVLVDGARMWLECRVHMTGEMGDHRLVVLEVLGGSSQRQVPPLTYHDGAVTPLTA
jgi:flavin reductase (DIM6/NTAB) family NADH-FMN oxidoreductase RutF